jgi:hypothetical protein
MHLNKGKTLAQCLHDSTAYAMNPEQFRKLIEERALTEDVRDVHMVNAIREEMEGLKRISFSLTL